MTPNTTKNEAPTLYIYQPSHVLPAVFAILVGISWVLHICQNIRYKFWRITFWICWGGALFMTGWIVRCVSSYHPANVNLYIVQTVLIYAGPPVYSASAYNIVGRLMNYLPMHAVLNPNRVLITFVYIGAAAESITVAGAAKNASAGSNLSEFKAGGTLIAIGLILQGAVETLVIAIVATVHRRCARAGKVPRNVRKLSITLYGTSTLGLLRCIFRAVEAFEMFSHVGCRENCGPILSHEWFLYAFELGPMFLFTWWLNVLHPGQSLPNEKNRYLDLDGRTERLGPGWIDRRSTWATFMDPFDFEGMMKGKPAHDLYWLRPNEWPVCDDGSFALGTGSNARNRAEKSGDIPLAREV